MPTSRRDLLALLIAVGATIAGMVVWDHGTVSLGMTLESDGASVRVHDVTPDGNAARLYWSPGMSLLDITTRGAGDVERGEPIGFPAEGVGWAPSVPMPWSGLGSVAVGLTILEPDHRLPVEAVAPERIETAISGQVYEDETQPELEPSGGVDVFTTIDRVQLERLLQQSIWMLALGIALGAGVWRLLVQGIAGARGRELAVVLGAAVATPFLLLPVVVVGTPIGIAASYLVPAAIAVIVGATVAGWHPDRAWAQTGIATVVVAAGLAVVFVVRYLTAPTLTFDERGGIFMMIAAIAAAPAVMVALAERGAPRTRASILSVALVPIAAQSLFMPRWPDAWLPMLLLVGLLGWQLLPVEAIGARMASGFERIRSRGTPGAAPSSAALSSARDWLTLGFLALIAFSALVQSGGLIVVAAGLTLGGAVAFAVRRRFLGAEWIDAAIPLAGAVSIPVVLLAFEAWYGGVAMVWVGFVVALGTLGVAHLLASRHSDPVWRGRLFLGSIGLVGLAVLLGGVHPPLALFGAGMVPLLPAMPAAFAEAPGETRALTSRLETLAVALTPAAATTVLIPGTSGILLMAWLVAIVVWRRFTLAPLLFLAQRTQLQRDLAVAAAETERARLAADLHDDAIQQLTMLVRKLDDIGQTEAAAEAREVADKLRSVVGDLRLPILDDLGAGAALEWLVERVEPLAGGPVKLERSDEARPPASVELAVFRVAQEALTNAIKHGKPSIAVRYDVRADGRVTLAIDDAGEGIGSQAAEEAPREGHFGLLNMQQRAEQIGALLDVRRWPSGGTRVALEWRPS